MVKLYKAIPILLIMIVVGAGCASDNPVIQTEQTVNASPPTEAHPPTASTIPETPNEATVQATDSQAPVSNSEPSAFGPDNYPANVNPLTGIAVSDQAELAKRPLAIKVQIFPRGQRPTWGVSQADIVYDFYQNNGMTRLHTLFYSRNAETVGPIRSARLLDLQLIKMYKSIFAFGGAEYRTRTRLFNAEFADRLVVEGHGKCPPLCRVDPNGYNYLVANTEELSKYATENGIDNTLQDLRGMKFDQAAPEGGGPGQQLYVRHSISAYNRWDYNPDSGRYLRFQDTNEAHDIQSETYAPFIDGTTGEQIEAENVVVVIVPHQYAFGTGPGPGEVVEMRLDGSGPAFAFRDGKLYEVTWNRPNNTSVLYLTFPDGTPYPFKPGSTWFELIGLSSQIDRPVNSSTWRFQHNFP